MENTELIFEVTEEDFEQRVVAASAEHAVVVDFWAPWCGPCHMLGPVLERVVLSYQGKVVLAKVNVDENQGLAAIWNIQGIPAVKIFKAGKVAGEFVGALPESEVRQQIAAVMPSEADELVLEGDRLEEEGNRELAETNYRKALELTPRHPRATLKLSKIFFEKGDYQQAQNLAKTVGPDADEYEETQAVLARIGFIEECSKQGGLRACEERLAKNPADMDSRYALACCLAAEQHYKESLENFLKIVETDKQYGGGMAKEAMVRIFSIIGQRSNLADEYRTRLSRMLYV